MDGAVPQGVRQRLVDEPVLFEQEYRGLYCEGCEGFKQEKDLDDQGRCPEHLTKPREVRESNFFFRLSTYEGWLKETIESGVLRIEPESRRNEVLAVIRQGLQDFRLWFGASVSCLLTAPP